MNALRTVFAVLLLAIGLPAHAGDILATEIQGSVLKGRGNALGPMRTLDRVVAGERMVVRAKSRLVLYVADEGALYTITGPAEIQATGKGLRAAQGTLPPPSELGAGYTGLKFSIPDLVQGSLVMRAGAGPRVESPEAFVSAEEARRFRWTPGPGSLRFELATDKGELLHRTDAFDGALDLPAEIVLKPGEKYVWGIGATGTTTPPVDWTEFVIRDAAANADAPSPPGAGASPSEWLLYSAWLRTQKMPRAATRAAARSNLR
jgi:hypothetical protein